MEHTYKYNLTVVGDKEWMHVNGTIISPCCRKEMRFDHFRRRVYICGYTKHDLMIEVHRCPKCGRQHSILPDFLAAYKRYTVGAICQIVKSPTTKAEAAPSTKLRMIRWLTWYLKYAERGFDGTGTIRISDCTKEDLIARLSAAACKGK